MNYHHLDVREVLRQKASSFKGLTEETAQERLKTYGENKLHEEKRVHPFTILLRQFNDTVVYILLFATILSFILKEYLDAYVIISILIFDALIGFFQEYKAERAVELLKKLTMLKANVVRNGVVKEILSSELVPGDIILLEGGDKIPADARIIEAHNLQTSEASLTGESLPCSKIINTLPEETDLAERKNMLYASTIVTRGTGKAVIVETGMSTEIGKIATLIQDIKESKTPLQVKLQALGKTLGVITLIICAIVFLIGVIRNLDFFTMLLTAVSLAVAAIPEGLPAVVTVCLALSVQHMIKRNALIKKLKSIETLGDITVICSDKTGTITKNEMTVTNLYVNNTTIDVTGYGYSHEGEFLSQGKPLDPKTINLLLEIAITCNNATETTGDPTEVALLYCALKGDAQRLERVDEIPFDSDKKYMATIHRSITYYKGAVEVILEFCNSITLDGKLRRFLPRDKEKILKVNKEMAENALRVLAFAYEKGDAFVFVGLMGMIDPPKEGVKEAIALCRQAGIRPIMITGDHPLTAQAIAHQIGMDSKVTIGHMLDQMNDEELRNIVTTCDIYARTSSTHKVRILEALKANNEIVAMTGDGINDAPALKKADVGVAMSIRGTDVSRDAAQMVITDDNFSSIVNAIEQGRIVYDNIKKFVLYLLSANTVEVSIILLSLLLGLPLPLLPIHLLWVNLMTDSWPALALGVDPPEEGVMTRKPRGHKEHILKGMYREMITTGIIGTIIILGIFAYYILDLRELKEARTITLTTLIIFEIFRAYSCRSKKAFTKNLFANTWLNLAALLSIALQLLIIYTPLHIAFKLEPLPIRDWAIIILLSLAGFALLELSKIITASRQYRTSRTSETLAP